MQLYFQRNEGEILIVSADGGLTRQTLRQLYEDIGKLAEEAAQKIVIDCSKLILVNLRGTLGLLKIAGHMKTRGASVKVARVGGKIPRLLLQFGLGERFQIYGTVAAACAAFGSDCTD